MQMRQGQLRLIMKRLNRLKDKIKFMFKNNIINKIMKFTKSRINNYLERMTIYIKNFNTIEICLLIIHFKIKL